MIAPARSPLAQMAAALLAAPASTLSDPRNDLTIETSAIVEEAHYGAGRIFLIALQERARTKAGSDAHLRWSGALAAAKRLLQLDLTHGWPEDDTR